MTILLECVPNISDGLNTAVARNVRLAKTIATDIREKGGGMPGVKARGYALEEQGQVQVSMNLVDNRKTSPIQVFDEIPRRAEEPGVKVVGLIPEAAVPEGFAERAQVIDFDADGQIIERRVASAAS